MEGIRPAITIPMHYKTEKCGFPIAPVEEFTRGRERVRTTGVPEIEVSKETLPGEPEIIVLAPAL